MVAKNKPKVPINLLERIELGLEASIFAARWVLVPAYVILSATLVVLTYKTIEEFLQLILNLHVFDESHAILQALTIVDLVLVLNLILMVIFVGYINFVSKIHTEKKEDWPDWMNHLGYSGLKVQLLGSVIAVASIKLLRTFIELTDLGHVDGNRFLWEVVFYLAFVVAVFLIAIVNWINRRDATPIEHETRSGRHYGRVEQQTALHKVERIAEQL
jgi:uncharacterized protein (TIGR00645 family)